MWLQTYFTFSRGLDMLGHKLIQILFLIAILFWISTAATTLTAVLWAEVTLTEVPTTLSSTNKSATDRSSPYRNFTHRSSTD